MAPTHAKGHSEPAPWRAAGVLGAEPRLQTVFWSEQASPEKAKHVMGTKYRMEPGVERVLAVHSPGTPNRGGETTYNKQKASPASSSCFVSVSSQRRCMRR